MSRPSHDITRLPGLLLFFPIPVTRRKGENPEKGVPPSHEVPEELYPLLPFTAHSWDFVTWLVSCKKS